MFKTPVAGCGDTLVIPFRRLKWESHEWEASLGRRLLRSVNTALSSQRSHENMLFFHVICKRDVDAWRWGRVRPWAFKGQRRLQCTGGLALHHHVQSLVHKGDAVDQADLSAAPNLIDLRA